MAKLPKLPLTRLFKSIDGSPLKSRPMLVPMGALIVMAFIFTYLHIYLWMLPVIASVVVICVLYPMVIGPLSYSNNKNVENLAALVETKEMLGLSTEQSIQIAGMIYASSEAATPSQSKKVANLAVNPLEGVSKMEAVKLEVTQPATARVQTHGTTKQTATASVVKVVPKMYLISFDSYRSSYDELFSILKDSKYITYVSPYLRSTFIITSEWTLGTMTKDIHGKWGDNRFLIIEVNSSNYGGYLPGLSGINPIT